MRLQELAGKEVVNLVDATRFGLIRRPEVLIDTELGRVEALLMPIEQANIWRNQQQWLAIPWRAIRRVGPDLMIVELKTPPKEDKRRSVTSHQG